MHLFNLFYCFTLYNHGDSLVGCGCLPVLWLKLVGTMKAQYLMIQHFGINPHNKNTKIVMEYVLKIICILREICKLTTCNAWFCSSLLWWLANQWKHWLITVVCFPWVLFQAYCSVIDNVFLLIGATERNCSNHDQAVEAKACKRVISWWWLSV